MRELHTKLLTVSVLIFFFFISCKKSDDILVHIIKDEYNAKDQHEIGKTLKNLIYSSPDRFPILSQSENAVFYKYINELISMLANTDKVENRLVFNWDVTIIQDDSVANSFITPGGHIFIYTGLLKFITSENELFALLAHEINYADKSDLIKRLESQFGKEVIGDLLLGYDLPTTRNVAYSIKELVFAEEEVLVADRVALTLICPFQYDAFGLQTFLEAADTSNLEIQWLMTHPSSITRIESIEEFAKNCGIEEDLFTERYSEYKALLP